ncbi:MAG TPA: hypothetical protein VGK78_07240 [Nocardioides sp.]|uniref:hypothetical protein n=1 Tax=Nocardioides sp. TaxID=35761 RepID=UPI002F416D95
MSGVQPPPPGWQPPESETPPQRWQQWGPPPNSATPGYPGHPGYPGVPLPVAHKPGAIPLRPLVLSDIFDGAFRIIRYNPRATIGAAVLVSAVAMILPIAVGLASGSTGGLAPDPDTGSLSDSQIASVLVGLGGLLAGAQLQSIGLLFVSGMIAHVSSAAAVGRRLSMAEAWAATRGKRWRLLGMSFMLGLGVVVVIGVAVGVLVVFAVAFHASLGSVVVASLMVAAVLVVAYLLFWVRMRALAVPTLMLEPVGVFGALGRAVRLTRQQFWRLLGLLLLMALVVGVAGSILRLPFSIAGQLFLTQSTDSGYGLLIYLVLTAVGTVISAAVLQPFSAAVSALLYIDQRIRKEAYDVELLGRAGILPT